MNNPIKGITKDESSKKISNNYFNEIQSLQLFNKKILIGTRSGTIFECSYLKKSKHNHEE